MTCRNLRATSLCGDSNTTNTSTSTTTPHPLPFSLVASDIRHVGQIQPAVGAHRRCCSQCHQDNHGTLHPPQHQPTTSPSIALDALPPFRYRRFTIQLLTDSLPQRNASSSSSEAASQWRNTAAGSAATLFAVGSVAWYYYQFGRPAHAMTPSEEGFVFHSPLAERTDS